MINKSLLLFSLFIFIATSIFSQVAWIEPTDATVDSTVTVYFDAAEGDQGLKDYTGDVYAHTGVITMESTSSTDWKHVVADWGTANDTVLMTRQETNLYSITFNIRDYYNIAQDETVLKLAFVFRNVDGSVAGRDDNGSDIFIPLENENSWNYQSFINSNDGLQIITSNGKIRFRPYSDAIETEFLPDTATSPNSYAIVGEAISEKFSVDTTEKTINAEWENWRITIEKNPLQIQYIHNDSLIKVTDFLCGAPSQGGIITFNIKDQNQFYGGGSRALPFNLHGYDIEFYNQAHYGYANQTPNLNISIPVIASPEKYALLFHNHYPASADIGVSNSSQIKYKANDGPLRFFILGNNSLPELLKTLADLTGHAPMPPRWGLGYIQSRYGYQTRYEAEQIVADMRSNNFPMDALVLDLYWFGGTNQMGSFSWDTDAFPQPEQMIQNLEDQGVETILISEPYFTLESDLYNEAATNNYFATNSSDDPYVISGFWAGDASLLDMTSENARNWLWPEYQEMFQKGVDGLWTDLAEPESHPAEMQHSMGSAKEVHNLYNNLWAKMLHEKTKENYPDKRLLNLTRSGYTGMQRYSTYPWSGDIQRSFSGLQAQIPIMLHMSMSGEGYMHSDIGGFTGGTKNPELFARWMQMGAFSPVMRAHGTGIPPEPIYYPEETQDIVRKAIKMRYDFLPYNYSLAWKYSKEGIPPVRPMNFYHPESATLSGISDQYFWGKDLIVAPVLHENTTSRMVSFPEGLWAGYDSGKIFEGNTALSIDAPQNKLPLFIREGGFIVQSEENLPHTKAYNSDSIRIRHLLPSNGTSANRQWYHDDGKTSGNYKENRYNVISMSSSTEGEVSTIKLKKAVNNITSPERHVEFMLYGLDEQPGNVTLNGYDVPIYTSGDSYKKNKPAAYWDKPFLYTHMQWKDTLATLKIDREEPTTLADKQSPDRLNIQVSPNPFEREANIQAYVEQEGSFRLTFYRIDGKAVGSKQINWNSGRHRMNISDIIENPGTIPEGIYILQLKGARGTAQTKIVKRN